MQLIRGLHNLQPEHQACALTIGNFDGVHLGHQQLLKTLKQAADERGLRSCIMSFEPLPHEYFNPEQAPARLYRLREKWCAMESAQIDYFLCCKFNQALASLTADEFIQQILLQKLKIKYLLVGDDFRFGNKRCGDFAKLQQAGEKYGFEVYNSESFCFDQQRVSSTRIREALLADQLDLAAQLMNRPYQICGRIAHGDKRGRTIGFPTANIKLKRHATAVHGVYAVHMSGENNLSANGVANIGRRPTVDGEHLQLEVHLFDFSDEIYGQQVCVEFRKKIREEKRFESFELLKDQIIQDSEQAKQFFAN